MSIFDNFESVAVRTVAPVCPAELANCVVTFGLVNQSVDMNVHPARKKRK
jgi:hypothetical protein